mmetsp:Transcript_16445/g.23032  ORF Transcript_16445/g.23032 Transcript_16445/m.23032 type:complete len:449 (+) Transcript_16445:21-1367(+)
MAMLLQTASLLSLVPSLRHSLHHVDRIRLLEAAPGKGGGDIAAVAAAPSFGDHETTPAIPALPKQFAAVVNQYVVFTGVEEQFSRDLLFYDEGQNFQRKDSSPWELSHEYGIHGYLNETNIDIANSSYYISNRKCAPNGPSSKFSKMWSWIAVAAYQGNETLNGTVCSVWALRTPQTNITLWVEVGSDLPRSQYIETLAALPGAAQRLIRISQNFSEVKRGPFPPEHLKIPDECFLPPLVCEAASKTPHAIQTLDHFLAHPEGRYNISNQNTADILGDTVFTCADVLNNGTALDGYALLSHYKISLDTRYGEYALCNGYPGVCTQSRDNFHVGREASYGGKDLRGQCSDNSEDIGTWFSLPAASRCKSRADLDEGRCAWFIEERVKTINLTCPFQEHDMLGACGDGMLHPGPPSTFSRARAIFSAAFASADATKGGCPDVGGPAHPPF